MKFEIESKFNVGDEVFALVEGKACKAKITEITENKCNSYFPRPSPLQYTIAGLFKSRSGGGVFLYYNVCEDDIFRTESEAFDKEREYQHQYNEGHFYSVHTNAKNVLKLILAKSCHTESQREARKLLYRFVREMEIIRKLNDDI